MRKHEREPGTRLIVGEFDAIDVYKILSFFLLAVYWSRPVVVGIICPGLSNSRVVCMSTRPPTAIHKQVMPHNP
mgnify:CR=1 FL=1